MQFLNPLFLLGCLSVIGPILVHLIRREESKKIPFSSLMFVKRVSKRSLQNQKIRHPLLLLLRISALAILAFAFARPFVVSQGKLPFPIATPKSIVLLIDNSYSMRAGERFQRAKDSALEVIDSLSGSDTVQAVLYSDVTQILNHVHTDKASLRPLLLQCQPGFHKTSHPAALRLAQQLLSTAPHTRREIHWITDFQQTGWNESNECALSEDIKLVNHDVGKEEPNVSVRRVEIRSISEGDSQLVRLSAIASNDGSSPSAVVATLMVNQKTLEEKKTVVKAEPTLIEFNRFPAPPGISTGEIRIESKDSLPDDNVSRFTLSSLHKTRVLLLADAPADNYYLNKSLAPSKSSVFQTEAQSPRPDMDLSKYAAVVLNDIGSVPVKLARTLEEFVNEGGGLITVLGPRARPVELNRTLASVLPATLSEEKSGVTRERRLIGLIQKEHPVFEIFKPVHQSYFMTTQFLRVIQSTPDQSSEVLVKLEDATPLLLTRTIGRGRSLLFTSSLNMDWNDLPTKSVFLPLVHQIVKYSTAFEESSHDFVVGETVPMRSLNPMLGKALNRIVGGSFNQSWKVLTPSRKSIELDDRQLLVAPFFTLEEPGFYSSRIHNIDHSIAVNIAPQESDLRKISPERLAALIKRTPSDASTASRFDSGKDSNESLESNQRIWWYLLLLATSLLAVESFVSNRYYKGVPEG